MTKKIMSLVHGRGNGPFANFSGGYARISGCSYAMMTQHFHCHRIRRNPTFDIFHRGSTRYEFDNALCVALRLSSNNDDHPVKRSLLTHKHAMASTLSPGKSMSGSAITTGRASGAEHRRRRKDTSSMTAIACTNCQKAKAKVEFLLLMSCPFHPQWKISIDECSHV